MNRLLCANFKRFFRNKVMWVSAAVMLLIGILFAVKTTEMLSVDKVTFIYALPTGLALAAFVSLFIGTDYSDGTIRNKLITGHKRISIYLSNLIVSVAFGILMCKAYLLPIFTIGFARLGFFTLEAKALLMLFGISLMLILSFASIYTLISMLCQNKAVVAVVCVILFIVLLTICAYCNMRLSAPEFLNNYIFMDDSGEIVQGDLMPNPDYVSGTEREIYQFIYDFLPTGQAMMFLDLSMVHTWQLAVYSLIIFVLTTGCGLVLFERLDLR